MHAHQTQVDHFADDRADLYAVSDPDSIFADQEEIPDDGYEHALHGNRQAGGEQTGKGGKGADFSDEAEPDDPDDDSPQNDRSYQQQLIAATRLMRIAKHCAPPHFGKHEYDRQYARDNSRTNRQRRQGIVILPLGGISPIAEVMLILLEQYPFLGQRDENVRGLLEQPGPRIEFIAQIFQCPAARVVRLGRERIAARRVRLQLFERLLADLRKRLRKRGRMLTDQIDGADLVPLSRYLGTEFPYPVPR